MQASTVLVTGGGGYVAGWCAVELLNRGYRVRATIRAPEKEPGIRAAMARHTVAGERPSFVVADLLKDDGRAAWDLMAELDATDRLTTILPGAVFGPVLSKDNIGSVKIIQRLLDGRLPALPRLGFAVVDVRDLASIHVRAMTTPAAAGQRFLVAGEFVWMEDIARTLRSQLGAQAAKVPTRRLPNVVFRLAAALTRDWRSLAPLLGRVTAVSADKARRALQFSPRPVATTILDTAASLLE